MTVTLGSAELAELVREVDVIGAVEAVHHDLGTGAMVQHAPTALTGGDEALFLPMVARSDRLGLVAVKLMADIPRNTARGLPSQRSTILVSSIDTGECVAVLDGAAITRARTAAASAVATKHLARTDATTLGLVGAGNLAVEHVRALRAVRAFDRVVVWSRSEATLGRFTRAVQDVVEVQHADDPRTVVGRSDVVCTLTPSVTPVLEGGWLRPGQHVNAVGARPRPDHRELDGPAMARGVLVVDSRATAESKSGDLLLALAEGALAPGQRLPELGEVVAGRAAGRTHDDEVTVFDSVGLGAQDLALAAAVLRRRSAVTVGATDSADATGAERVLATST